MTMSAASGIVWVGNDPKLAFFPLLDEAPLALAQCRRPGIITVLNPALKQILGSDLGTGRPTTLIDLIRPDDRKEAERQLLNLFDGKQSSFRIESKPAAGLPPMWRWTAWKMASTSEHGDAVLALAQRISCTREPDPRLQQVAKLESAGRLAGGLAHDFNNMLTGALLCCDLLMASIEASHPAREYAEEVRGAGMQASGQVQQLLTITRPSSFRPQPLSLNDAAEGMRNLLVRLAGDNVQLTFRLEPNLRLVALDATKRGRFC